MTLKGWRAHICESTGGLGDSGTADRFFPNFDPDPSDKTRFRYCPKAPQKERYFYCHDCRDAFPVKSRNRHVHDHIGENGRPTWENITYIVTQKPIALMRWLVRLVMAPGNILLDPFAGSGTTLIAAHREGFEAVGIEKDRDYHAIAEKRIEIETAQERLF